MLVYPSCQESQVQKCFLVVTKGWIAVTASCITEAKSLHFCGTNVTCRQTRPRVSPTRKRNPRARAPALHLLAEQIADCLLHDVASNFCNRSRQRDIFRTNLQAVLCIAALLDASVAHER